MGVALRTYQGYEAGERRPPDYRLKQMAMSLRKSFVYLAGEALAVVVFAWFVVNVACALGLVVVPASLCPVAHIDAVRDAFR